MLLEEVWQVTVAAPDDTQALFEEARRRTRRRRASRLAIVAAIIAAAFLTYGLALRGQARSSASASPTPSINRTAFTGHGNLAFVSWGRLWVLDGATGSLTAVTNPSAQASSPAFSPNGRWLLYGVTTSVASELWLSHANGSSPRLLARGSADASGWLADGRLLLAGRLWRVAPSGALTPVGSAPSGLLLAAPPAGGHGYIFLASTLRVVRSKPSTGVERIQVSSSPTGKRTTWLRTPVSYSPQSGLTGPALAYAIALPKSQGLLIGSGRCCDNADGVNLYDITHARAAPRNLGRSVGDTVSLGAGGVFAFTRGGNRYAWVTKAVETCSAASGRCKGVTAGAGELSLDPAFSPNGEELAFVEAAASKQGDIGQAAVERWYATHSLWIKRENAAPTRIAGTVGAASPVWSSDGRSLLYTADDALWLLPALAAKPVRIASPLFAPSDWPSFYGEVGWSGQFAWSAAARG